MLVQFVQFVHALNPFESNRFDVTDTIDKRIKGMLSITFRGRLSITRRTNLLLRPVCQVCPVCPEFDRQELEKLLDNPCFVALAGPLAPSPSLRYRQPLSSDDIGATVSVWPGSAAVAPISSAIELRFID